MPDNDAPQAPRAAAEPSRPILHPRKITFHYEFGFRFGGKVRAKVVSTVDRDENLREMRGRVRKWLAKLMQCQRLDNPTSVHTVGDLTVDMASVESFRVWTTKGPLGFLSRRD